MSRHTPTQSIWIALSSAAMLTLAIAPTRADELLDRAQAAYSASRWPEAERLFRQVIKADPTSGRGEYRLGVTLLYMKRTQEAVAHLDAAEKLGWTPSGISYRRAALKAQQGDMDGAFAMLEDAALKGLPAGVPPSPDPLMDPIKADPRFKGFMERLEQRAHPCRYDAHYRDFDYWIGEWDVRAAGSPPSSPAAENIVTREYDGCVVQEHWTPGGAAAAFGSSFSIFDTTRKMWFQTWVDSVGGLHDYHGSLDPQGNMAFVGETTGIPGQPGRVPVRLTFFKQGPDRIRQFSEISTDGGKSWTTNYDLVYTRRKPAATN
ncbi:MAG: hypothetical protein ABI672_03705 [Vicinamibacteria bacterium]